MMHELLISNPKCTTILCPSHYYTLGHIYLSSIVHVVVIYELSWLVYSAYIAIYIDITLYIKDS